MEASKNGVDLHRNPYLLKLNTIVADQPQERQLLGLKSVGSFPDCSLCMLPSRSNTHSEYKQPHSTPMEVPDIDNDAHMFQLQTSRELSRALHVSNTVSRHLIIACGIVSSR